MRAKNKPKRLSTSIKKVKGRGARQPKLVDVALIQPHRQPATGYPVFIRKEVGKKIWQVTGDQYRWYLFEQSKKEIGGVPSSSYVIGSTYAKGKGHENWLATHTFEEAMRILHDAQERGTRIHASIAHILKHGKIDPDDNSYTFLDGKFLNALEVQALNAFEKFYRIIRPVALGSEQVVINKKDGYGGTYDFLGVADEGAIRSYNTRKESCGIKFSGVTKSILLDWKSGKDVYDSHMMQTASYAEIIDVDYYGVVHLAAKNRFGFKLYWVNRRTLETNYRPNEDDEGMMIGPNHFEAFKHCLALFNMYHGKELPAVLESNKVISIK